MCKCPVIAIVKIYTEAYKGTYKLCTPHILDLAEIFFCSFSYLLTKKSICLQRWTKSKEIELVSNFKCPKE